MFHRAASVIAFTIKFRYRVPLTARSGGLDCHRELLITRLIECGATRRSAPRGAKVAEEVANVVYVLRNGLRLTDATVLAHCRHFVSPVAQIRLAHREMLESLA